MSETPDAPAAALAGRLAQADQAAGLRRERLDLQAARAQRSVLGDTILKLSAHCDRLKAAMSDCATEREALRADLEAARAEIAALRAQLQAAQSVSRRWLGPRR